MKGGRISVGIVVLVCLGAALLFFAATPAAAQTCDTTVTSTDSIQDAVYNTQNGSTVCVQDGTYNESVEVNRSLTIVATGTDVVLDSDYTKPHAFRVVADDVAIDGFEVHKYGATGSQPVGIGAGGVANVSITNNTVRNVSGTGVQLVNVENATVSQNTVDSADGNGTLAVSIQGADGTTHQVVVHENTITGTYDDRVPAALISVTAFGSQVTTVSNVSVANNTIPADVNNSANGAIGAFTTHDLGTVENVSIADNVVTGAVGSGIGALATNGTVRRFGVTHNHVDGTSGPGLIIRAQGTSGNVSAFRVADNTVNGSAVGIGIGAFGGPSTEVAGALVETNTVTNATQQGIKIGGHVDGVTRELHVRANTIDHADSEGILLEGTQQGTAERVLLQNNDISNTSVATRVTGRNAGTVRDVGVLETTATDLANRGIVVAGDGGLADNVTVARNQLNTSGAQGVGLEARNAGHLQDVNASGNDLRNSSHGVQLFVQNGSAAGTNVTRNLLNESTGNGIRVMATRDGDTIDDTHIHQNFIADGQFGIFVHAANGTIDGLTATENLLEQNAFGVAVNPVDDGVVRDVNVSRSLVSNQSNIGVIAVSGTNGSVRGFELTQTLLNESNLGVVLATDDSQLSDVRLEEVLLANNTNGAFLGANTSADEFRNVTLRNVLVENNTNGLGFSKADNVENVTVTENVVRNNAGSGILFDEHTSNVTGQQVDLSQNIVRDNGIGINNSVNGTVVAATENYWGASDGPSSASGSSLRDPDAKLVADGSGDSVTQDGTTGVSNVRFAPAIGGKRTCGGEAGYIGDQLRDIVPSGVVSFQVLGETISGPRTDFVGLCLWDRAALPLRADTSGASMRIGGPDVFFERSGTQVSLNRQELGVFDPGQTVPFTFQAVDGALDTQMFADEDAQLVVGRVTGNASGDVSFDVDVQNESATLQSGDLEIVDVTNTSLDGNGELASPVEYTPSDGGIYVAVLVSQTTGDGLERNNSNLSIDVNRDDLTVVGVETIAVRDAQSTVTPSTSQAEPGETVDFDVDAQLGGNAGDVEHALVLYHEQSLLDTTAVITDVDVQFNESNLTLSNATATIEVSRGGTTNITEVNVTDLVFGSGVLSGTINDENVSGENDLLSGTFVVVTNTSLVDGNVTNTTAGDVATLSVQTGTTWTEGTYRYVHAAATADGDFSTATGTIDLQTPTTGGPSPPSGPGPSPPSGPSPPPSEPPVPAQPSPIVNKTGGNNVTVTVPPEVSRDFTFECPLTNAQLASGIRITRISARSSVDQQINVTLNTSRSPPAPARPLDEPYVGGLFLDIGYDVDADVWTNATFEWQVRRDRYPNRSAGNFSLYRYNETTDAWETIQTTVVETTDTDYKFRSNANGFSVYAAGVPPEEQQQQEPEPEPEPEPDIRVTDASLSTTEIVVGETVQVQAVVENRGNASGTKTIELFVDGETVATEEVTLESDDSQTVVFSQSFEQAGSYEINVDDVAAGTVLVDEADPTPDDGDGLGRNLLYGFVVLFVLALAVAAYYFYRETSRFE